MIKNPALTAAGLAGGIAVSTAGKEYAAIVDGDLKRYTLNNASGLVENASMAPAAAFDDPIDAVLFANGTDVAVLDGDKIKFYAYQGGAFAQSVAATGLANPKALANNNTREMSVVDGAQVKTYLYDSSSWVYSSVLSVTSGLTDPRAVLIRPGSPDRAVVDGDEVKYYSWDGTKLVYNPAMSRVVADMVTTGGTGKLSGRVTSAAKTTTKNVKRIRVRAEHVLQPDTTVTWSVRSDDASKWVDAWRVKGKPDGTTVCEKYDKNISDWAAIGTKDVAKPGVDTQSLWIDVPPGKKVSWQAVLETEDSGKTPKIKELSGGIAVKWEAELSDVDAISLDVTPDIPAPIASGETLQLNAELEMSDGSAQDVTNDPLIVWTSSNDGIATVSDSGLVTGISDGSAAITAEYGVVNDSVSVTVGIGPGGGDDTGCFTKINQFIVSWIFKDPHVPNTPANTYDETAIKIPNPQPPPVCPASVSCAGVGGLPAYCQVISPCTPEVPPVPGEDGDPGTPGIPEVPASVALAPGFPTEMDNPCYYSPAISAARVQSKYKATLNTRSEALLPGYDSGILNGANLSYTFNTPVNVINGLVSSEFFKSNDYRFRAKVEYWVKEHINTVPQTLWYGVIGTPELSCTFPEESKEAPAEDIKVDAKEGQDFCIVYLERPRVIDIVSPPPGQAAPSELSPVIISKGLGEGSLPAIKAGGRVTMAVDSIGPMTAFTITYPYLGLQAVTENLKSAKPAGSATNTWKSDFFTSSSSILCPSGTVIKMNASGDAEAAGSYDLALPPYATGVAKISGNVDNHWLPIINGKN
jgi:hypothetical protein